MERMSTRHPYRRLGPALLVLTGVLAAGSAAAAATVLHGRGDLVSEPLTGDLEVVDARLEPLLVPGGASDVTVRLRNRSTLTVMTDRVTLTSPLRDARPAGCGAKVSGPLLGAGLQLTDDQRLVLAPGHAADLVLPSALALAPGATGGCGFRVQLDVRAVPAPTRTPTRPAPASPTTSPSLPPVTVTPEPPTSEPPTSAAPTGQPSTVPTPPIPTLEPCDPVDPDCE
jgi:hypothetical protein